MKKVITKNSPNTIYVDYLTENDAIIVKAISNGKTVGMVVRKSKGYNIQFINGNNSYTYHKILRDCIEHHERLGNEFYVV
jgi:hypothetical protein